jgi:hypothetical protein
MRLLFACAGENSSPPPFRTFLFAGDEKLPPTVPAPFVATDGRFDDEWDVLRGMMFTFVYPPCRVLMKVTVSPSAMA